MSFTTPDDSVDYSKDHFNKVLAKARHGDAAAQFELSERIMAKKKKDVDAAIYWCLKSALQRYYKAKCKIDEYLGEGLMKIDRNGDYRVTCG